MAAKHSYGNMGEFDQAVENWESYIERMEQYFVANDVTSAAKKRAILLSTCGPSTYTTIHSLAAPNKPTDMDYKVLLELTMKHYNPRPSVIMQRYKFNATTQQPGESISSYVVELRKLTEFCDFGESLNDMLRDKFVSGLRNTKTQHRLLSEKGLTFAKAQEIAQAMELADKDVKSLQSGPQTFVHKLQESQPATQRPTKKNPQYPNRGSNPHTTVCYRCGGKHLATSCHFKTEQCHVCGKIGHIARVCHNRYQNSSKGHTANVVESQSAQPSTTDSTEYTLFPIDSSQSKTTPWRTTLTLNGEEVEIEIDTGASVSLISQVAFDKLQSSVTLLPLKTEQIKLRTFIGEEIKVLGSTSVTAQSGEHSATLPLLVVKGNGPNLIGRNWLTELKLDWKVVHSINTNSIQQVVEQNKEVFQQGLRKIEGVQAKLHVDSQARPLYFKARSVPYALRQKVEQELERLEKQDVITPVLFSDWATPIVPVVKSDGSVRVCGDYKLTANKVSKTDRYPLPKIEDIFASLAGGETFSKLDLSYAYLQVPLDKESQKYLVINTHKGLYAYKSLPFRVASAPAIFQCIMDNLLQGLSGVCTYLDDILVTGKTHDEHINNLTAVLTHLRKAGMRLKKEKCQFSLTNIEYLGHAISSKGLEQTTSKVIAIVEAPAPRDVSELKSLLGLVNYYGKFLPDLATTLAPLYRLLRQGVKWQWESEQEATLVEVKKVLQSSNLLTHFDPTKSLVLACDASPVGVGAVLSHRFDDGTEKPISYASRTLTPSKRKYSQLDKEALSIIFGIKHYHQYLYGHKFTILSDHKPLMHILSESKSTPAMVSARIQRWAILLGGYHYHIEYKPGRQNANADAFSRLPVLNMPKQVPVPPEIVHMMDNATPVTVSQIRTQTVHDPTLSRVMQFVMHGWTTTDNLPPEVKPFLRRKFELSVQNNCLLWGGRIIVPPKLRDTVSQELHATPRNISDEKPFTTICLVARNRST